MDSNGLSSVRGTRFHLGTMSGDDNMRRKLMLLIVVTLGLVLVGCFGGSSIHSGANGSDVLSGFLQMKLDDREYDLENAVILHASYGHDYIENFNENNRVVKHTISIYTIAGNYVGRVDNPSESIELYEISYEGEDLGSDIYRCYPGLWLFSTVKYNMTIDISIDFSEVEYDSGLLVMRFAETYISQEMIEGVLIETETTHYVYTFLFFVKDDATIKFSKTSFA